MPDTDEKDHIEKVKEPEKNVPKKSVKKIIALVFIILIIAAPFTAQFVADKYANSKLSELFSSLKGVCNVTFGNARYNIWNRDLIIKNIKVSCSGENAAEINEIVFKAIVNGSPVPSNMVADISGGILYPQVKVFDNFAILAEKLGYSSIPFYGRIAYTHGVSSKEFKLSTFKITAEGMGEINAELKIPEVTAKTLKGLINNIWENKPAEFWVSFKNKELAARFISYYAKVTDTDDTKAKAAALRGLENRISRKFKTDIQARERLIQLYRFFQNPTELVVKLNAKDNASLKDVFDSIDYKGWRTFTESLAKFKPEIFTN